MPRRKKQTRKRRNLLRDRWRLSTPFRKYLEERGAFGDATAAEWHEPRPTAGFEPEWMAESMPMESSFEDLPAPVPPTPDEVGEVLPIFSNDGRYKGDKGLDGKYHCYEKAGGKYVSHYKTGSYQRLCDHLDILHNT